MSHSFTPEKLFACICAVRDEEELGFIQRAKEEFIHHGHIPDEPTLHYAGDGRVWVASRSATIYCSVCNRLIDILQHDSSIPDDETRSFHGLGIWVDSKNIIPKCGEPADPNWP